ncbi:MAG TPA: hypothetical protein PL059_09700 [Spirochaetota bacterium]|nr:hypothetical protein [Spirochaetota bacterium]HPP49151.1 hypothetical protein [Spirochaetota bacterium]
MRLLTLALAMTCPHCHCEARSAEAIFSVPYSGIASLALAMT